MGTAFCTTCDLGVIEALFSSDLNSIIFDVGGILNLVNKDLKNTSELCQIVFESDFIDAIVGLSGATCSVEKNYLTANLGPNSNIREGFVVKFKKNSNVLQLDGCYQEDDSERFISEIMDAIIKLPLYKTLIAPQITTNNFPNEISLCRDL